MLYELLILGDPTQEQLAELKEAVSNAVECFGLNLGQEVGWSPKVVHYSSKQKTCRVAVFFASLLTTNYTPALLKKIIQASTPILPILSRNEEVASVLPRS